MNQFELKEHFESAGYIFNGFQRYKNHDAVFYAQPPNITYARLGLTCRLEDVPDETWNKLFPIRTKLLNCATEDV